MEKPIKSEIKGANRKIINQKYNIALKKYNDWKKSQKPKSKDPRPTYSDKKYKNYNEFRQDVLAWKKRNDKPKEYISPKDRKFNSKKLKIKKESEKSINEYVSKHKNEKGIEKVKYPVQTGEVQGEEKKIEKKDKSFENRVTGGGESKTNNKNTGENEPVVQENKKGKESKKDNLKIKKGSARNFIKTKKGFARRGTPMAKRAEEKEKARKRLAAKGYMKNK